jgi:hypothetical protein
MFGVFVSVFVFMMLVRVITATGFILPGISACRHTQHQAGGA